MRPIRLFNLARQNAINSALVVTKILPPSCNCAVTTYVLPGPQAVGQVLGVQNSERALESRFMFLKKATAA